MEKTVEKKKAGIGAFDFFCIGFGAIVGVGWAVSINKWMASTGGAVPAGVGYLIALIMMIPVALCYCELAPMMPVAGGGMAYSYRAFGEKVGFISGWAAFGAFVTLLPWEAIYVVDILSILIPSVKGPLLYTLGGGDVYLGHLLVGTFFSLLLFWINWKGATSSAMMQRVLTIFLICAGLGAMIVALTQFDPVNYQPIYENVGRGDHKTFFGGTFAIMASAPFFLCGFETIPQAVEEASGDVSTVGKTVVLSVGCACLFYAGLLFALGGAMPWQDFYNIGKSPAAGHLFLYVFGEKSAMGIFMYYFLMTGALCGLFTTWNSFMMASPRLLMGMARGYLVPNGLKKEHPQYKTPSNAMIFCLVLSISGPFLGIGLINALTSFSAAGFVLSWFLTSASAMRLRKTAPDAHRPYKMPGGFGMATFATVAMAIILVLLFVPGNPVYMGMEAIVIFIGWMLLGVVFYLSCSGQRKSVTQAEREAALFAHAGQNKA
ncbi:MAG: steT 2 [Firmicutes bacterium]|nr:steT 2 [Bacillota bacterium]